MPFHDGGSLWGRWDLHFHTPASFDYKNGSVTSDQIIAALKSAGVSVVAITDHHVIEVPRIRALQKLGGDDLTVLPGIEFRTELGGKEKVHLIGIFPEEANLDDLWTKLSGKLEITPEDVKKKTDEAIYVDFKEAADVIRDLGGIVTTHAGGKSNSIENIGNNTVFKMALKTDLACECVDIYEVGKLADRRGYEEVVFPAIRKVLPLIMGSDNHDITHYEVEATCWIKGDPSFRTFQQLISDPQRAFLGETPEELIRIDGNPTKYVSEIQKVVSLQAYNAGLSQAYSATYLRKANRATSTIYIPHAAMVRNSRKAHVNRPSHWKARFAFSRAILAFRPTRNSSHSWCRRP